MNFSPRMLPGLALLAVGAFLSYGSGRIARKPEDANRVKLAGVLVAAVGAALVFLV